MFMKVDLIQVSCDAIKLITLLIMPHLVLRSTLSTKSSHHAAAPATQCVSNVTLPRLYAFNLNLILAGSLWYLSVPMGQFLLRTCSPEQNQKEL